MDFLVETMMFSVGVFQSQYFLSNVLEKRKMTTKYITVSMLEFNIPKTTVLFLETLQLEIYESKI